MNASSLRRACLMCCAFALALCFASLVLAQTPDPAYVADMPSVDRVETQIKGTDPTDTLARQVAVFEYLQTYIQRIKEARDYRGPYSPGEQKLYADYAKAQHDLTQSFTKTHTPAEVTAFNHLEGNYSINNALDWIKQLEGPKAADTYKGTEASLGQSYRQHEDQMQQQMKPDNGQSGGLMDGLLGGGAGGSLDPDQRRCLELGGAYNECANSLMGAVSALGSLLTMGAADDSSKQTSPSGVILVGSYHSRTDLPEVVLTSVGSAVLQKCGTLVDDNHAYTLRKSGAATQIVVANEPDPIVLTLRSDGSLSGPGSVVVKGNIISGYHNQSVCTTGTLAPKCSTTSTPLYSPSMQRCTLSQLAPQPAPPPPPKPTGLIGQITDMMGAGNSLATIYGLRVMGLYASSTGMLLSFDNGYATLDCGAAHVNVPYAVDNTSAGFVIHIQNAGGPFLLAPAPDNTLRGSGATTVSGRLVSGINGENVSYRSVSATCNVGAFTPKSPDDYKALTLHPPAPASVAATPSSAAPVSANSAVAAPAGAVVTPSGSGALASMHVMITSGFTSAPNPLVGQVVSIRREKMASALHKLGVAVSPDATSGQALQTLLKSCGSVDCRSVLGGMKAYDVANIRLDANGNYTATVNEPTGPYFFACMVRLPDGTFSIWEVPANLHAGDNTITFQSNNAEIVKLDLSAVH